MKPERTERVDWPAGLPDLIGPGLTLREPSPDDAGRLVEMLATDGVGRFMNRPPANPGAFGQFIEWARGQRRLARNFCYGIVPDGEAHPVGLIQVRQVEPGFASAEWGFALGEPYWGRQIFATAARIVIDFIFRNTGAHRLEARSAIQNGRANGALKKLGASPEGVLRQSFMVGEEPLDQVLWSLRIGDWSMAAPPVPYAVMPVVPDAAEAASTPAASRSLPDWCGGIAPRSGRGVSVRELVERDAEALVRLVATPEVSRYILPPPSTADGFRRFVRWASEQRTIGQYACLGIVPDGCDHAVGLFQLHRVDNGFHVAEWGFVLGQPYWGSGVFPAAADLFLEFAFDTVGVHRLEARAAQANVRASGALSKIGAVREGSMKRSFLLGGEYHDDYLWAILASEWRRRVHTVVSGESRSGGTGPGSTSAVNQTRLPATTR